MSQKTAETDVAHSFLYTPGKDTKIFSWITYASIWQKWLDKWVCLKIGDPKMRWLLIMFPIQWPDIGAQSHIFRQVRNKLLPLVRWLPSQQCWCTRAIQTITRGYRRLHYFQIYPAWISSKAPYLMLNIAKPCLYLMLNMGKPTNQPTNQPTNHDKPMTWSQPNLQLFQQSHHCMPLHRLATRRDQHGHGEPGIHKGQAGTPWLSRPLSTFKGGTPNHRKTIGKP